MPPKLRQWRVALDVVVGPVIGISLLVACLNPYSSWKKAVVQNKNNHREIKKLRRAIAVHWSVICDLSETVHAMQRRQDIIDMEAELNSAQWDESDEDKMLSPITEEELTEEGDEAWTSPESLLGEEKTTP